MSEETKLQKFLTSKKLDARRLLAASYKLERLTLADRTIKAKKGNKAEGAEKVTDKPRSGRPVTQRALNDLFAGKTISGPTKQRILRAVNALLEQKKQEKVDLKTLF
ncbi:MAG TPA: hypothetical protein VF407_02410 [Polyangiaceae bacterium]